MLVQHGANREEEVTTTQILRDQPRGRGHTGTSVSYKRFPALAQFTEEELAAITMPPQPPLGMSSSAFFQRELERSKGGLDQMQSTEMERARTQQEVVPFSALSSFRAAVIRKNPNMARGSPLRSKPQQRFSSSAAALKPPPPPFRPVNPSNARELITERTHGYVTMRTPYDAARLEERQQKASAAAAHRAGPFVPSSAAQAKSAIRVHYFLNSPDTETFAAERQYIRERAARNMESLNKSLGKKLLVLREREKKQDAELLLMQDEPSF